MIESQLHEAPERDHPTLRFNFFANQFMEHRSHLGFLT
jgi:hypothetical protein